MSIPNRPGSRAENLYGNMIGQETATPPTNPQSRIEDYLDYILNNGTQLEQEIKDDVDALKGIGRYLSLWDCTTGKPMTDPKKFPYKYKSGDYYIVSAVGNTNYMPSGTQYEGVASSTTDSGVSVNDFYLFDGTTWSRMAHASVESVFVVNYTYANGAWSYDKTFDEIKAAYDAGKPCLAAAIQSGFTNQYYLRSQDSSKSIWESHSVTMVRNGNVYYNTIFHYQNNTIGSGNSGYGILPSVSSSDDGKVLGVSNGQWDKVDPPTELPAVTASDEGKVLGVDSLGEWHKLDSVNNIYISILTVTGYSAFDAANINDALREAMHYPYNLYVNTRPAYLEWFDYHDPEDPSSYGSFCITVPHISIPYDDISGIILSGTMHISATYDLGFCAWDVDPITVDSYDTLPSGGYQGQVLKKASSSDFDCVWANESGGGDVMVVKYTWDSDLSAVVRNYTYSQIFSAIANGIPIVGSYNDVDILVEIYAATIDGDGTTIELVGFVPGLGDHLRVIVRHNSNESLSLDFCADRPIEFDVLCDSGIFIDQISGCDLDVQVPVDVWNRLMNLIVTYGSSVGRCLCAKVSVYYTDPVFHITGHIDNKIRYYCKQIFYNDNTDVYTFNFAADDGSSLSIDADVSDPNNIVYSIGPSMDCKANPAVALSTAFPSYAFAVNTGSICGMIAPGADGLDYVNRPVVCFDLYPATQKFLVAAMSSMGTDVTITYDATDDPAFSLLFDYIAKLCIVVPTVDLSSYDGSQACLYLTRKFYITNYMSEYLECKFPFNYNNTQFMIDIKTMTIVYSNGTAQPPVITITGNATPV